MNALKNFWRNDQGFLWLLVLTVATLMGNQFGEGTVWVERFFVRFSFFIFFIIAIRSSVLSSALKKTGYTAAVGLLLLAILIVEYPTKANILIYGCINSAFVGFILILIVRQIFGGGEMTFQKIGGGVAAYILIGHLWTSLYLTQYEINALAFQMGGAQIPPDQALRQLSYFSFVTLTTIGYGDITATASLSRALVMLEGLLGQLFPAIFIAKLVSHQIEDSKKKVQP